jgi:hypothetical protein
MRDLAVELKALRLQGMAAAWWRTQPLRVRILHRAAAE